jgi:hypothetical protein
MLIPDLQSPEGNGFLNINLIELKSRIVYNAEAIACL